MADLTRLETPPTINRAGLDFVAIEAGRSPLGIVATIVALNGTAKVVRLTRLADPLDRHAFAVDVATATGVAESESEAALLDLYLATETRLQEAPAARTPRPNPSRPDNTDGATDVGPYPVSIHANAVQFYRDFILSRLCDNEYGDALVFAQVYRGRVVFDHADKAWFFWAEHHWKKDDTQRIAQLLAGQIASLYLHLAAELTAEAHAERDQQKEADARLLIDRARDLRARRRVDNVLSFAASLLGINGEEWDADPDLLGCLNGVIDLRTGQLRDGRPEDYIRTYAPVPWQGLDVSAPRWEQFVREILRPAQATDDLTERVDYLQRLLGYGITGYTIDHVLPIFCGKDGRNGKDTLFESLGATLGPLAAAVSRDVLIGRRDRSGGAEPHLYDLRGKRLVWVSETNQGARLNAGQVKLITGGGRLKVRPLYGNMVEFAPTHVVCLITNHRPHAPADDDAFWQRVHAISFEQRFLDNPDPNKPNEHKRDLTLRATLAEESSGILAWLVRGTLAWRQKGLSPPKAVRLTTQRYREEEDLLGQFIEYRCVVGSGHLVKAERFYYAYKAWMEAGGEKPLTMTAFGTAMAERFAKRKRATGFFYHGVGLITSPESALSNTVDDDDDDANF